MASPISEMWVQATVAIENEWAEKGTGFLVSRELENGRRRIFVVTNKHVINDDPNQRSETSLVHLGVNVEKEGQIVGEQITLSLQFADTGLPLWREHPDQDVDVFAFDITVLVKRRKDLRLMHVPYWAFADVKVVKEEQITAGDEIVVVGYPKGIRQGRTNYPLVRQGMLATRIEEELHEDVTDTSGSVVGTRILRGFLIDGAMIPGSSGSPVILKPVVRVQGTEAIETIERVPAVLLGIIAETRYSPRRTPTGNVSSFTGLALAFNADTIRETIELFFDP